MPTPLKLLARPERKSAPEGTQIDCRNCGNIDGPYNCKRLPPASFAPGEESYIWCKKFKQKPKNHCPEHTSCMDCVDGEEWFPDDEPPRPFDTGEERYYWCTKHFLKLEDYNWPCESHTKFSNQEQAKMYAATAEELSKPPEDLKDEPVSEWILENFHDNIIYVMSKTDKGEYYVYDGCKWVPDKKRQYQHLIIKGIKIMISKLEKLAMEIEPKYYENKMGEKVPTKEYADACKRVKDSKRYLDYSKIKDLWQLMQGKVAIDNREFDTNYNLLNFKNGTLEIDIWKFRAHRPEDMLTKCMAANYDESAGSPLKFIDEINRSFKEYEEQLWMQVFYGGALARRPQKKFYHMNGLADAGKTTILNTIMKVLGDDGATGYAAPLPPDVFTSSKARQATRNDLLMTRHCCVMGIDEQKSDERQDSSLAKGYTGGSLLNIRGLYEENQLLPPSCTIINTCNKLPPLDVSDQGMTSRQVVIPFEYAITQKIPEYWNILYNEECDKIALWLMKGLKYYLEHGLPDLPKRFKDATNKYIRDNNIVDRFTLFNCKLGDGENDVNYRMTFDSFYSGFKSYAEHVEKRKEQYIPGADKVIELLSMRGIKLIQKPTKIVDISNDGMITRKASRNVLYGIRFKNREERHAEVMDAMKDEPVNVGELPMEIHMIMMDAPNKTVDFNWLNSYFTSKGIATDTLLSTIEHLKARGEIMAVGPGEYQLV